MAIRLVLDTSDMRFLVSRDAEPKMEHGEEKKGQQKRDKKTQLPLWTVQLVARHAGGADVIMVSVPAESKPTVTVDASVQVVGLEAVPWVKNGSNSANVAYRAEGFKPLGK